MTQLALKFDAKAAQKAKDAAIAKVEARTDPEWAGDAWYAVQRVMVRYSLNGFTSDDISGTNWNCSA